MKYAKIIATGSYLPAKVLTNADLEQMVETNDAWIVERTGIRQRHIAAPGELTSDMAYLASLQALAMAKLEPSSIDMIIVATSTPDALFPSTACLLQHKLGIKTKGSFDLQAACAGFIYALATADNYIKSKMAKTVLVVGVDCFSRIVDYTNRNTCILFGDGAGAVILQESDEPGILANEIRADGSYSSILACDAHFNNGTINGNPFVTMDGQAVFKVAVRSLPSVSRELAARIDFDLATIDWVIPHQANIRILEATAKALKLDMAKMIVTVDKHGNTSAASVPLALDVAVRDGRIKRGDNLLLQGVGAGFAWGASLVKF